MRFPYVGGRALLAPRCYNTVEIGPPIAPRDIPYWEGHAEPSEGRREGCDSNRRRVLSFHRRLQEYPLHARRERRCHL